MENVKDMIQKLQNMEVTESERDYIDMIDKEIAGIKRKISSLKEERRKLSKTHENRFFVDDSYYSEMHRIRETIDSLNYKITVLYQDILRNYPEEYRNLVYAHKKAESAYHEAANKATQNRRELVEAERMLDYNGKVKAEKELYAAKKVAKEAEKARNEALHQVNSFVPEIDELYEAIEKEINAQARAKLLPLIKEARVIASDYLQDSRDLVDAYNNSKKPHENKEWLTEHYSFDTLENLEISLSRMEYLLDE